MATLQEQLDRTKGMTADALSNDLFAFIKSISEYMIALNKKQIKDDSSDIYGNPIGFYSKATDEITNGAKEWGTPFTGVDTGEWMDKFYMGIAGDVFYFGSTDPKTDDILTSDDWLSHDLFGLTDENLQLAIRDKFLPFIIKNSRKLLAL